MNSISKEAKNTTKSQKKIQKSTKKQQQKQQLLQQQQQIDTRNGKNSTAIIMGKATKVMPSTATTTATTTPTTTHNNNINNNNKDGIFLRPHLPIPRTILPGYENAPKFERSNSFSFKGKLSKIFNSITGSKENLSTKITNNNNNNNSNNNNNNNDYDENGLSPYKFTRSRSMILLRRSNRRSLIEPQLEQLSEEADPTSPTSPRKNSIDTCNELTIVNRGNRSLPVPAKVSLTDSPKLTPNRRQSAAAKFASSTPNETEIDADKEFTAIDPDERLRKGSTISLANDVAASSTSNSPAYNPQLNFQKRRSNTLISSFRSTLASLTGAAEKKKEKMNPKWSASLQSLQAIDNMVSYENMSFIDYDKFNGYEKQLEKRLSTISLMDTSATEQQRQQLQHQPQSIDASVFCDAQVSSPIVTAPASQQPPLTPTQTVVRRRRKPSGGSTQSIRRISTRSVQNVSAPDGSIDNFDTNYEHNLDKLRNVYRDSLDSRKLKILNHLTRDSVAHDKRIIDVLNLEDGSVGRRRTTLRKQISTGAYPECNNCGIDVPDCSSGIKVSQY